MRRTPSVGHHPTPACGTCGSDGRRLLVCSAGNCTQCLRGSASFLELLGSTWPACLRQIHLYIPETGSGLYGVSVRAILRDSTDVYRGRSSEVWLDSDGQVGNDRPDRTGEAGGGRAGMQARSAGLVGSTRIGQPRQWGRSGVLVGAQGAGARGMVRA